MLRRGETSDGVNVTNFPLSVGFVERRRNELAALSGFCNTPNIDKARNEAYFAPYSANDK